MMGVTSIGRCPSMRSHGATVVDTLFEDGDGADTFHAFNPTQVEET